MDDNHGSGYKIEESFGLRCSACPDIFEFEDEQDKWRDHTRFAHSKNASSSAGGGRGGGRPRTPSTSSNHRRDATSDGEAPDSEEEREEGETITVACPYCCKELDSKEVRESHIKQRHLDVAFVCKLCEVGDHHHETDLPAMEKHLRSEHDKGSTSISELKEWIRFPRNNCCLKCNMCSLMFHAQDVADLEFHFKLSHDDCEFTTGHLDFICRLCMSPGCHDTMDELKAHFQDEHPDI